jgi:iron complex outermembrane receptor protein
LIEPDVRPENTTYRKFAFTAACCGTFVISAQAEDQPATELEPVVVSAPASQKVSETARPVTVLTKDDLLTKAGRSIGETLAQELGMTSQSFGTGVGSPVIRGQAGPRVRVMQNGIGNNDVSQLSPDHANSVEPILADRIEVLRGPSTLLYGSGAIGGMVNVIDNRIPSSVPDQLVSGVAEQRYNSVSDETTSALKLDGGKGHAAFHLDGFYRDGGNLRIGGNAIDEDAARATDPSLEGVDPIQNSKGFIPNTNTRAKGGTVGMSWVGEPGFAGVSINRLENNYGIPPDGTGGDPVRIDLKQTKYDFKGELTRPSSFAEALRLKFGYTDYKHVELDGGIPATRFTNQSYESRLELAHKPMGPLRGVIGFQSVNSDFAAIGEEAVVPRSQTDSYALFAVESFDVGSVSYELGVRAEHQSVDPQENQRRSYTPVSGAASALWRVDDNNQLGLAVTQSQRAPQVQELFSNGVHEATRSFEVGDPNLGKEISYNLDLGYRFKADWVRAQVDLFHNWVNDYIFQQRTGAVFDEESETIDSACTSPGACIPVLQSQQADAIFKGFEAKLVLSVMENRYGLVDLTLFGDYTRGQFVNGDDVPRMPPLRYGFQLDYAKEQWSANLRLTRGEPQDNPGDNESKTADYLLLNIGAQYRVKAIKQADLILFARGNNLLDENIRNSTSYLRNFAPEPGRGAEIGLRLNY